MIDGCAAGLKLAIRLCGWRRLHDEQDLVSVSLFLGKTALVSAALGVVIGMAAHHVAQVPILDTVLDVVRIGTFVAAIVVLGTLFLFN